MTSIASLRQRRAQIDTDIDALLAADPSDETRARLKKLLGEKQSVGDDLAGAIARAEIERAGATAALDGTPNRATAAPGRRWAELHGRDGMGDTAGFKSLGEFMRTIVQNPADPRVVRANSGAVDSEGGFAVPTQFASTLMDASLEQEIVRPRARVVPMASRDLLLPAWADTDHSTNLFNGFVASWKGEADELDVQTPRLRQLRLSAKKLTLLTQISNELVADGQNFEGDLIAAMSSATAFFLDQAFLIGDGVNKPLGITSSPSIVTVVKESGQLADSIEVENLTKMYSRLAPRSQKSAVWIVSPSVIPALLTTGISVGTGGAPVFVPQGGLPNPPPGTLLGLPLLVSEKLPPLGDAGDILLVDLSRYVIGLRSAVMIDRSAHVKFTSDQVMYRLTLRVDAQGVLDQAITPSGGGSTLTWVVRLAERA